MVVLNTFLEVNVWLLSNFEEKKIINNYFVEHKVCAWIFRKLAQIALEADRTIKTPQFSYTRRRERNDKKKLHLNAVSLSEIDILLILLLKCNPADVDYHTRQTINPVCAPHSVYRCVNSDLNANAQNINSVFSRLSQQFISIWFLLIKILWFIWKPMCS